MADDLGLRFDHIGMYVNDAEAAGRFYIDHLQMEMAGRDNEANDFLLRATGNANPLDRVRLHLPEAQSEVRLIGNPGAPLADANHVNPGTCHLCFYTDDLEQTWAYLERQGTRLISTHIVRLDEGAFDGFRVLYCVGPDGYRVEFLQGPLYLDGSARDASAIPQDQRANETSHVGIQVRDHDRSIAFYRDVLGIEHLAGWLEDTVSTKAVVGYPSAALMLSILRLPGTQSYLEIIEYRGVDKTPIDNSLLSNGACHLTFRVNDLAAIQKRLEASGTSILHVDADHLWCADPDGNRVQFIV